MPGFPLGHLIDDFIEKLVTNNPTYAPAGPPDFTSEQIVAMTKTFSDIATSVHNHILSWYVTNDQPFPDEMVKVSKLDPTSGYLEDKLDGKTLRVNPDTLKAEVYSLPYATDIIIGGVNISRNPESCIVVKADGLYVRTQQNLFLSNSLTEIPTVKATKDYVTQMIVNITGGGGLGDMLKMEYDVNGDGVVDNAEMLGGQLPDFYLDFNNLNNIPEAFDKYNFYENVQFNYNQLLNPVIHNLANDPLFSLSGGQLYFNTTQKRLMFFDTVSWLPCFSAIDDFINLTEGTAISDDDYLVIYDTSVSSYRRISRSNLTTGLGAGIANAYDKVTDGSITANATSNDTLMFRAGVGLTVVVGSNNATYGDNVLYGIDLLGLPLVTTLIGGDTIITNISAVGDRRISWADFKNQLQTDKFVKGPTSSNSGYIPTYENTSGNLLSTGYSVATSITTSTTAIPTSNAVKTYVDGLVGSGDGLWTLSGGYLSPLTSSNIISLGLSSGIGFGDNDTHIKQTVDDVLAFTANNSNVFNIDQFSVEVVNSFLHVHKSSLGYATYGILVNGNLNEGIRIYGSQGTLGYNYLGEGTAFSAFTKTNRTGLDIYREENVTSSDYSSMLSLRGVYTGPSTAYSIANRYIYIIDDSPTGNNNTSKILEASIGSGGSTVTRLLLWPRVSNIDNAVAYLLDTVNNLTATNSLLMSLRNAGSQKFSVDGLGNLSIARSMYQSFGTDGITLHSLTGGNTQTTGKAVLDLYLDSGNNLQIVRFGNASTATLFSMATANSAAFYNDGGNILIGTIDDQIIHFATNNLIRASLSSTGLKLSTTYTTYTPTDKLSVLTSTVSAGMGLYTFATGGASTFNFYRSQGALGTLTTTPASSILGAIKGYSVNSQSQLTHNIALYFIQDGDAKTNNNNGSMVLSTINGTETDLVDRFKWYANGNFAAAGTVLGSQSIPSDIRLKHDIGNIDNPLGTIKSLRGVRFKYNTNYKPNDQRDHLGLIAQEVVDILPILVTLHPIFSMGDKEFETVNYTEIIPILIEAIKELSSMVENLSLGTIK